MYRYIEVSREEGLEMFAENKFKVELITNLPADAVISCYRCGPMVDLCRGPHLPVGAHSLPGVRLVTCGPHRLVIN
jgi:threonyl-tRNA synthetase